MVWLIIPTYNESENIKALVLEILRVMADVRIVVVDDNSPDGTADIVAGMAQNDGRIHLILRLEKLGYATAIVTGLRYALDHRAEFLGHMDADFSHDPKWLPELLQALQGGADVALGSRYVPKGGVKGWSFFRQALSQGANLLVRTLLGLSVRDCTSGFRLYRREALKRLPLERLRLEGYGFLYLSTALAVWNGLSVAEVPIVFTERRQGKSKLSRRIVREAAVALVKTFVWRHTGRWLGRPLME